MTYTIEDGIPIPPSIKSGHSPRPPRSPMRRTLDAMEVGQSFMMDKEAECRSALNLCKFILGRRYTTRKIAGVGWRIWRVA